MSDFGPVSVRRMFGGAGVSHQGVTFAIIIEETLYLKEDALNAADFDAESLERFSYAARGGKRIEMRYRRAPPRLMDDRDEMALWCRKSYEAALRARSEKYA
ncbi:MAG TPA: TfoX/Sxy family protein [Aestuariivirgaceae bacterium]